MKLTKSLKPPGRSQTRRVRIVEVIEVGVRLFASHKLLLVLSDASIFSEWVMTEIRRARKRELAENRRVLFPVRLTDIGILKEWVCFNAEGGKALATEVREYFIPNFSNWKNDGDFEKAFNRLVQDLKKSEENATQ